MVGPLSDVCKLIVSVLACLSEEDGWCAYDAPLIENCPTTCREHRYATEDKRWTWGTREDVLSVMYVLSCLGTRPYYACEGSGFGRVGALAVTCLWVL